MTATIDSPAFLPEEHTLIAALASFSHSCPGKQFMTHQGQSYTYQEVDRLTNGIAEFLHCNGVVQGDRVGLALQKRPELVLAFLGALKIGAIPAPLNYTLGAKQYNACIHEMKARVILLATDFIAPLTPQIRTDKSLLKISVGGEDDGFIPWSEACRTSEWKSHFTPCCHDIAYLNYTSGTTGLPKGAVATHANLYWNSRAAVEAMAITGLDTHLCMFAPFAHPHEIFSRALYTGGDLVLLDKVNPKTIAATINQHRITSMMGLAPMYEMMMTHCSDQQFSSLRIAESGGMYTRPDVSRDFQKTFGLPILSVWGSTETSGIALANTPDSYKLDGSMGKACPYYEVKIVDATGKEVADNTPGELTFKGKGVIAGYGPDDPLPGRDGWYHSGDIAKKVAEGYFYFIERKSGLIKVAGLKVYPLQVELQIKQCAGVKEVAVIGVKERRHGMVPKAYIVAIDGQQPDIEEIKRHCKERLANYMVPKSFEILTELPKIGSGKIDRKRLHDLTTG